MADHKFLIEDPNLRRNIALDVQLADAESRLNDLKTSFYKKIRLTCPFFICNVVFLMIVYTDVSIHRALIGSFLFSAFVNITLILNAISKWREIKRVQKEIGSWEVLNSDYKNCIDNKD